MLNKRIYKRLPGSRSFFGKDTLWLAEDHILYVVLWFITEDYRRFYFRDIRALTYRRTAIGRIANIILTGILAAPLATAFFYTDVERRAFLIVAAVFGFLLLINVLLGPTCDCYIDTAVQRVKLTPLTRTRKAKRVLRYLTPYIQGAQSETGRNRNAS